MSFKILIVDDSPMMRRLVRLSIEEHLGWRQCVEAESGQAAIERARETSPDVVILDWQMPGMSGVEAARELSRVSPKAAIALLTLHEQELVFKEAKAAGVQRVFSKTKSLTHLLEWLRTIGGQQHRVVGL
jgi:DNA-binding NarL/FixJ family response regulator